MKKDAISAGMFIAIGFLCVAIVIAVLIPVVRDVVNSADDKKPEIPGVTMIQSPGLGQNAATLDSAHSAV